MIAVFQLILNLINELAPLQIVDPDERAVHVRCGKIKREVGPGIYCKIPFFDHIATMSCAERTVPTPTQSLITRDLRGITVSGCISYEIINASKAHYTIFELEETLTEKLEAAITVALTERHSNDLQNRIEIESEILHSIQSYGESRGIDVHDFVFTNLTIGKTLRILQE